MPEHQFHKPAPTLLRKIWSVLFILFYPVLITFSLLFTGILLVFSGLSNLLFKLIQLFSAKPDSAKTDSKIEPTLPSSSANS